MYTKRVWGTFRSREAHGDVSLDDCVMGRGVRKASRGAAVARYLDVLGWHERDDTVRVVLQYNGS